MKDDSNIRMTLGIMGWVLFVFLYISIFIFFKPVGYVEDLEKQLSDCQEQVPVWTLKVECYQTNLSYNSWNIFGTNVIWDRVLFEHDYTLYKDYQNGLDWYKNYDKKWKEVRNCEVLE